MHDALGEAKEFRVVGPSTAKTEFVIWLKHPCRPHYRTPSAEFSRNCNKI
jgi:hypothetical protein